MLTLTLSRDDMESLLHCVDMQLVNTVANKEGLPVYVRDACIREYRKLRRLVSDTLC